MKYLFLFLGLLPSFLGAQTAPVPVQDLDTVVLQATRIEVRKDRIPAAVSVYQVRAEDRIRQQLSLQEYVQQMPGVFTQNVNNFAQDLRVSIRGFGARSSFGIRGVKLIVDGIPETTPDGQGQLDNLNLGIIKNIEVLKGPSSSLYGNASGGVISVNTLDNFKEPFSNYKASVGAFGFQNYQVTAGLGTVDNRYIFHANYGTSQGYRDQSGFKQINTNFKGVFSLGKTVKLTTILNYADSPEAQDSGGLTLEEVLENRRQARQRNVDFKAGEVIQQFKVGGHLSWRRTKATEIKTYAFYSNRSFNGKLPFEFGGAVTLVRDYMGQGTSLTYKKQRNTVQVGYDFAYQNDKRQRFLNLEGTQGDLTLDQKERFTNLGVYVSDILALSSWYINGGIRFDYNRLAAVDHFLSNGDDGGVQMLNSFSGNLGVSYKAGKALIPFMSIATSFETPTLSELSANPSGEQGFNDTLEAQKAVSLDVGLKGDIGSLQYNITGFFIRTRDDLVPFELADFPDREFYRNAGETERLGLEVQGSYAFANAWQTTFSYALSHFTYNDFQLDDVNLTGKYLPGIPRHNTSLGIRYAPEKGFHASVMANLVGSQFANDGNTVTVEGYEFINVRAGYLISYSKATLRPYIGINNLLDQAYTDNVRINAFGGRFYEPASGFNVYGGVSIRL